MSIEESPPYRTLALLDGDEVVTFLHRVPTGTPMINLARWCIDVRDASNAHSL
jgi:hypothetical protein